MSFLENEKTIDAGPGEAPEGRDSYFSDPDMMSASPPDPSPECEAPPAVSPGGPDDSDDASDSVFPASSPAEEIPAPPVVYPPAPTGRTVIVSGPPAGGGKQKRPFFSKLVLPVLLCCLLSLFFGAAGGLLAGSISGHPETIIYQSVRPSSAAAGTVSDVAAGAADTVVEITTESVVTSAFMRQYISTGAGSGVIISPNGYIVTNHHVIEGAQKIDVTLRNGTGWPATVVGSDAENDIAVLKIPVPANVSLNAAVLGDSDSLLVGEQVAAIGNPLGELGGTVTDGIVSALERSILIGGQEMTLIQTNAAVNPGNSGGGLFNMYGELVGIVNAKSSGSGIEGLAFVIPVNTAKPVINDLITFGYVKGRTNLGVSLVDVPDASTAYRYRVSESGVYVSDVSAHSDGALAGLEPGDRIAAIDGVSVSTASEVTSLISGRDVGDTVSLLISRNRQMITLSCVLTEYVP